MNALYRLRKMLCETAIDYAAEVRRCQEAAQKAQAQARIAAKKDTQHPAVQEWLKAAQAHQAAAKHYEDKRTDEAERANSATRGHAYNARVALRSW